MRLNNYIFFLLGIQLAYGQLSIVPLSSQKTSPRVRTSQTTHIQEAQLPFWDDFSISDIYPDSIRVWEEDTFYQWDPVKSQGVFINSTLAITPPTYRVATFDGLDDDGSFHDSDETNSGITDQLVSYPIDLSGKLNVILSFFWQAGGNVELPEEDDYLKLSFSLDGNNYEEVWSSQDEEPLLFTKEFDAEYIQVEDTFLSNGFRFKFESFGDPDGPFDAWHIDWVFLNDSRSMADSTLGFYDGGFTGQLTSPFFPFNSLPINQFLTDNSYVRNQTIEAKSLARFDNEGSPEIYPLEINYSLVNNISNEIIYSDIGLTNGYGALAIEAGELPEDTLIILMQSEENSAILSEQPFSSILNFDSVTLTTEISIRSGGNTTDSLFNSRGIVDLAVNDTVRENYILHNYFAYDDGTAEFAAGTNVNGGQVVVKYWVNQPDTLTHMDIHFANISPNKDGSLVNLKVYNDLGSTALRSQQIAVISDTLRNTLIRYELQSPLIVSDTFYIGYEQFFSEYLGIGFDRSNIEASQYIYEFRNNEWFQNVTLEGALMIRPVFDQVDSLVLGEETLLLNNDINLHPNPTNGNFRIGSEYEYIEVVDLSGKILLKEAKRDFHQLFGFENGIYLIRIHSKNQKTVIKKLILED